MLSVNKTIYLELKDSNKRDRFKCKVAALEGNLFFIDYPVHAKTGKTGFFLDGTEFSAYVISEDDKMYRFDTEVHGRKKDRIPLLALGMPEEEGYMHVQRRKYVRIDTTADAAVHSPDGAFVPFTAVTKDISGGGAAIYVKAHFPAEPGMSLSLWFALSMQDGNINYVKAEGKLLRKLGNENDMPYITVEFTGIEESDRETVIRFCFERQLYYRRKGLNLA
ncbi:flagellar brake protein [Bacillus marinisedimentorum]|uniref:flagellar brake protein n=1 Tax=Bacillus marinisedimentorum TaxID=1821260 RepID=UPI00087332EB|nr:flagellar brake domain-containing protein [Bacillus marinisedimentorum]